MLSKLEEMAADIKGMRSLLISYGKSTSSIIPSSSISPQTSTLKKKGRDALEETQKRLGELIATQQKELLKLNYNYYATTT